MNQQRKPNFIIGGTSAGGTSFLAAVLVQHPEIYLPKQMRPEPHFFYKSWEYEKGLDYYHDRWFQNVPDTAIAVGERSSSYLFGEKSVAEKMAQYNPDLKLIFTLRNPIERTWANYRYTVLQGLEDCSFQDALAKEPERIAAQDGIWAEIQPHNYTGRGFYGQEVDAFLEFFPADQILLVKSELLSSDTQSQLEKIYKFLNLKTTDFVPVRAPDHTSVNVVNPSLQKELRSYFGDRFDKVIEACRKNESIESFAISNEDAENIQKLKDNMTDQKVPMPPESRAYLQNLFAPDIAKLKKHIDFDVSDWK